MSGFIAEREGFEPPVQLPVHRISSAARSTTPASLQWLPLPARSIKYRLGLQIYKFFCKKTHSGKNCAFFSSFSARRHFGRGAVVPTSVLRRRSEPPALQDPVGVPNALPHPAVENLGPFVVGEPPPVDRGAHSGRELVDQDGCRGRYVEAFDQSAHGDAEVFVGRRHDLLRDSGVLGAEDQREPAARDVEALGRAALAMGRGGDDAIAGALEGGDRLGRGAVAVQVDPLVGAPHDMGVGVELAERFDGVDVLQAEGFAMTNQRRGILRVVGVFREDRHVAGPHVQHALENGDSFGGHELRKAGRAGVVPGAVICGICHLRPGF